MSALATMPASHILFGPQTKHTASTFAHFMQRRVSFWGAHTSSLSGNRTAGRIGSRGLSAPTPYGRSPEDIFGKMNEGCNLDPHEADSSMQRPRQATVWPNFRANSATSVLGLAEVPEPGQTTKEGRGRSLKQRPRCHFRKVRMTVLIRVPHSAKLSGGRSVNIPQVRPPLTRSAHRRKAKCLDVSETDALTGKTATSLPPSLTKSQAWRM